MVSNCNTILSGALSDLFMCHICLTGETRQGLSQFHRVQLFALNVLDQCDFKYLIIRHIPDNCGNRRKARQTRRAPSPLACDQQIFFTLSPNHHGLDDSMHLDAVGKFLKPLGMELLPRLLRVRRDCRNTDLTHCLPRTNRGFWAHRKQCVQPAAESAATARYIDRFIDKGIHWFHQSSLLIRRKQQICALSATPRPEFRSKGVHKRRCIILVTGSLLIPSPAVCKPRRRANGHRRAKWVGHDWGLQLRARCAERPSQRPFPENDCATPQPPDELG